MLKQTDTMPDNRMQRPALRAAADAERKRLFSETAKPSALRLVCSQVSTTGVVMSTYVRGGDIRLGSFASAEPSE